MFNSLDFYSDNFYQEKLNDHLFSQFGNDGEVVLGVYVELDLIREGLRNE